MCVFERIVKEIANGLVLYTPVQHHRFIVKCVDLKREKVVFLAGKTNIEVSKKCWNGIPDFLRKKGGWVNIGAKHEITANVEKGTLEKYLRECTISKSKESQAIYVASLLEQLRIVQVKHTRTSMVKLV